MGHHNYPHIHGFHNETSPQLCYYFIVKKLACLILVTLLTCGLNGPTQAAGPYDADSIMFAKMMIPHHQQAVLISQWEIKQGSNQAAKKLAAQIIAKQTPEISQLKKWIPGGAMRGMDMPQPMPMEGILSDSDLAVLKTAHGKKFDGLYLVDMTLHHQGAIAMAVPLARSKNREVATLCKGIIRAQRLEIAAMRRIMLTGK
jgi:uncharacterized protein (DUF305 family)